MSDRAPRGARPGDWYAFCDICGGRFFGSTLVLDWKNRLVCDDDNDIRNEQDFIKPVREQRGVPNARPYVPDTDNNEGTPTNPDLDGSENWYGY